MVPRAVFLVSLERCIYAERIIDEFGRTSYGVERKASILSRRLQKEIRQKNRPLEGGASVTVCCVPRLGDRRTSSVNDTKLIKRLEILERFMQSEIEEKIRADERQKIIKQQKQDKVKRRDKMWEFFKVVVGPVIASVVTALIIKYL